MACVCGIGVICRGDVWSSCDTVRARRCGYCHGARQASILTPTWVVADGSSFDPNFSSESGVIHLMVSREIENLIRIAVTERRGHSHTSQWGAALRVTLPTKNSIRLSDRYGRQQIRFLLLKIKMTCLSNFRLPEHKHAWERINDQSSRHTQNASQPIDAHI